MFEQLVYAIYHNEGFGFMGGSPKKVIRKCLKDAQKDCITKGYNTSFLKSVHYLIYHKKGVSDQQRIRWLKNIYTYRLDAEHATPEQMKRWIKKVFQ